jgi:hypothetical protein
MGAKNERMKLCFSEERKMWGIPSAQLPQSVPPYPGAHWVSNCHAANEAEALPGQAIAPLGQGYIWVGKRWSKTPEQKQQPSSPESQWHRRTAEGKINA